MSKFNFFILFSIVSFAWTVVDAWRQIQFALLDPDVPKPSEEMNQLFREFSRVFRELHEYEEACSNQQGNEKAEKMEESSDESASTLNALTSSSEEEEEDPVEVLAHELALL